GSVETWLPRRWSAARGAAGPTGERAESDHIAEGDRMETNLARLADAALDRFGDYRCIYIAGEWHTSAGLHARATRVGAGFVAAGVRPGDRVVVIMANCPEVGIVYHALWRGGGGGGTHPPARAPPRRARPPPEPRRPRSV